MSKNRVNIPTIRGRIVELLSKARPRDLEPIEFSGSPGDIITTSSQERGVITLALLLLEQLRDCGGTRAPQRPTEALLKRLLASLSPREIMDLEVEAYETLLWIGSAIDPDLTPKKLENADEIDPTGGPTDLIRWAIASGEDLNMTYYTQGRGEMTRRRITPFAIEAETYVQAYCHLRKQDRVFRITRIADLEPAIGWNRINKKNKKKSSKTKTKEAEESTPIQPTLFD